jgi:hypothetical protein
MMKLWEIRQIFQFLAEMNIILSTGNLLYQGLLEKKLIEDIWYGIITKKI